MPTELLERQSATSRAADDDVLLSAQNIRKAFPGVVALDRVSLKIRAGRVHALMGENGAGKSTLMKVLSGIYRPDGGSLLLRGQPLVLKTPRDALDRGIAMIHQELNLLADMTVAENIFIGREPRNRLGLVDHRALHRQTEALLQRLGLHIDPEVELGELSIANRQMVEIAKAVSFDSDVLIMDEPTSAITDKEVAHLFRIIEDLKRQGKAIVYITHKMDEVFRIADDISVFRDGRHIVTGEASEFDNRSLIAAMVGRELNQIFPKQVATIGDVVLSVRGLTRRPAFRDVSFEVRAGEILGLAGLMGSGRTEVVEAIFGVTPADGGELCVDGRCVQVREPRDAIRLGMALLTEDRKKSGLFLSLTVGDNMEITSLHRHETAGFVRQAEVRQLCEGMRRQLQVKTPSLDETIENLSGGNQQKVLIGRWLLNQPRILILDEPTRGIDVGAKAEIHKLMTSLAQAGVAIVMISSELPEVMGMSDRILVMHEGRAAGTLARAEFSQEKIMALASGVGAAA
ncbi:sugar ABC transporter ATP-binding protein [Eleftheria terrae]|uniref:sugar ABC transporter ATP-binding protein n=1 Tax=Eleftheria terrae TaxID=1597781 RepID=UPI00263A45D2|nr:sugar ABC transporter ATP-binding protein [Eleftheria terrae]WKB51287.1 sugar ABC transporter ATP-binding protein [Eleftheria terrae]